MTKVSDVEIGDEFVVLGGNTTVEDAAKTCKEQGVKYIVVLEDDTIAGVVTGVDFMYDLVAMGQPLDVPISSIMSSPAVSCDVDDDIEDVAEIMQKNSYSILPVVASDGTVKGVITIKDVLYALSKEFVSENVRVIAERLMESTRHGVKLS
ncbi:MAG: CBS domain-containing protein [Methermicoccaceae archaeon]